MSQEHKYIFISYAHKDSDEVIPIINGLQKKGFETWYDSGIEAGTEWPEFIAQKIMDSAVVLVFLSKDASVSPNCRREINFAIEINKELLIIYLEDLELSPGMRMQLNSLQAMYKTRSPDTQSFIETLSNAAILKPCLAVADTCVTQPENKNDSGISAKAPTDAPSRVTEPAPAQEPEKECELTISSPVAATVVTGNIVYEAIQEYKKITASQGIRVNTIVKSLMTPKQINNAIKTFGNDISESDIVALLDTTLSNTGKEGCLFTNSTFYVYYFKKSFRVELKEIKYVSTVGTFEIGVTLHSGAKIEIPTGTDNREICDILNIIVNSLKAAAPTVSTSTPKAANVQKRISLNTKVVTEAVSLANDRRGLEGTLGQFKFRAELTDKQINNAIRRYARDINPDDIIALSDTTIMSSGKDGWVVTHTGLYDSGSSRPNYISFSELKSVRMNDKNYLTLTFANGNTKDYFYNIYARMIYNLLKELIGQ